MADALHAHEVLHTASLIAELFERHIVAHAYTASDPKLAAAAEGINNALADFYQLVGQSCQTDVT